MTARQSTMLLLQTLRNAGIEAGYDDANTLRRAQLTLHRWAELECGDGNNYASWAIERDETGKPFLCTYPHNVHPSKGTRHLVDDRERGALRRVAAICKEIGAHFYHQTDPRGCALYVAAEPLTDSNYNRGIACVTE